MPNIELKLPTASVIGRDGQAASARLVNAYAEQVERDGKAAYVLYAAPGLTRFDNGVLNGSERGMIALDDNTLIAVLGNSVTRIDAGGNLTQIGIIPGAGRVIMARNRAAPVAQIGIVTNDGRYYLVTGGNTVTQIVNPNLPAPNSIVYLAGRFLYTIPDGRIFAGGIDDGTAINAASFDAANANPDGNVRGYVEGGFWYIFGKQSVEIWQADASSANRPFPYSPVQQNITFGMLSPYSVASLDQGIAWIDDSGIVREGRDAGATRISTHSVERSIASLPSSDQQNIIGSVQVFEGHRTYTLTSASWAWVYDIMTQQWYQRQSIGQPGWRVTGSVSFSGKYIFADRNNARLYYLDAQNATENGDILEMEVWCGVSHRFPGQMIVDKIAIDAVGGVGLNSGNLHNDDPQIIIDYSDNGGKTFEGERFEPLGKRGEYTQTVESWRWGLSLEKGRIWRFRASASVLRCIIQAYLTARPVRG